jgi:alpha-maltose-1-phosphate synthase
VNVLVVHPGTQHSFHLAAELHRHRALGGLYTGLAFAADSWADRCWRALPDRWRRPLANRRVVGVPASRLHCRPMGEVWAQWRLRAGVDGEEVMHRRNELFQQRFPEGLLASASAVVGFDTASWILAQRCAARSVPFILDQSIAHPDAGAAARELAQDRHPEWNHAPTTSRAAVRESERIEHRLARRIVAATSYTARTLVEHGIPRERVVVNPYGVDLERFHVRDRDFDRPLRFLFVGSIGARKGVPLLAEAWRKLAPAGAELWMVGSASPTTLQKLPLLPRMKVFGAVPQAELAALMQQCDVFVFPSYFEGFGLVLLEAMACGLPVITTSSTAGPDLVTEGENGWVIEPGDLEGLTAIMSWCLEHRERIAEMGWQARLAAERFTWSAYGERWIQLLAEVCN